MQDPSTPDLNDNGWFPSGIPWAEFISRTGTTSDGAFAYGAGNQAVLVIMVFWEDFVQAIDDLLGSQQFNAQTGNLDRQLPMQHPVYPQLYAERITSVRPMNFQEKIQAPVAPISRYDFVLLTVQFVQPKYKLLSDTDLDRIYGVPRAEWYRFLELVPQPASFLQSRPANQWVYSEGGGGTAPVANTTVVLGPIAQFLTQVDYTLIWRRVPYNGLVSQSTGQPGNLISALNKVNSNTFNGTVGGKLFSFPPGTLLFKAFRFTILEDPVSITFLGVNEQQGQTSLVVDVELQLAYFDPPHGGTLRGWNLAPFSDQQWYGVVDVKTKTRNIFNSVDFAEIFQLQD